MAKSYGATAILLAIVHALTVAGNAAPVPSFAPPVVAGALAEPRNRETSGLAASRRTPGLLWTHNDSGGEPVLYAVASDTGDLRGQVRVKGVASFERDGKAWLVAGDIGDNSGRRPFILLHFIEEPAASALAPGRETEVAPAYTLRVVYEDLARDCESLAVDAREGAIYLLSKREDVPRLYRLPLAPSRETVVARRVGSVPHLPQPDFFQRLLKTPTGRYRGEPCAMDFAPDGSAAVVLTYGDTLLFPRSADESWAAALAKTPVVLPPHDLPQAEAACFSADGRAIFVASEETMTLLRYDRR
ncbi:MAG: hypothetical protein KF715_13320 [Candidatus Didemnitutus sp.]|nr:hypothetical protein [Candidatus Didemnitutus sp.]